MDIGGVLFALSYTNVADDDSLSCISMKRGKMLRQVNNIFLHLKKIVLYLPNPLLILWQIMLVQTLWACSGLFRLVWACLGLFGIVQACSGLFRLVWDCLGLVGAFWGLFGLVRACSGLFGLVRACLGLFRLVQA